MFTILAIVCWLASLVCAVIILMHAWKSAPWKAILGFFCGLYLIYYAFAEFQHEKKMMVILGWVAPLVLAIVFNMMGTAQAVTSIPR